MKIISSTTNKDGIRIVCEDAVFDPNLAEMITADKGESTILLRYDALESGHPLNLPLLPAEAELVVKLTPTGVHTSLLISNFGDDVAYSDYDNGLGSIEFDVRMTDSEKLLLLQHISVLLLSAIT